MKRTDTEKAHILARRAAHFRALEALYNNDRDRTPTGRIRAQTPKPAGLLLWRRLRRVETRAHNAATAQCNGEAYQGEPYRTEEEHDAFIATIRADVGRILGGVPAGFFVNQDPRGYALKIRTPRSDPKRSPDEVTECPGLESDWGGYGILAADIT